LEADLQGAKGLTVKQLLEVQTLYKVKGLDHELEKKLRAQNPELFQKPLKLLTSPHSPLKNVSPGRPRKIQRDRQP
jgi:hypothetical protein